jgi:hypothetical protein
MSDHNPNERIYLRSNKPLNEMTPEEIRAFAEEMYDRSPGACKQFSKLPNSKTTTLPALFVIGAYKQVRQIVSWLNQFIQWLRTIEELSELDNIKMCTPQSSRSS